MNLREKEATKAMDLLRDLDSLGVHVMDGVEAGFNLVTIPLNAPMARIAKRVCPAFYDHRMKQRFVLNP